MEQIQSIIMRRIWIFCLYKYLFSTKSN